MIKKNILILLIVIIKLSATGQNKADDIVGYYYCIDPFTQEISQNYIYKTADGLYDGKVVWVANEKYKNYTGLVFLKGLQFNAKDNEWQNGILTHPSKNGTYKTYMSFTSPTQLKIRGYWGVSLFGKTVYWTKEEKPR